MFPWFPANGVLQIARDEPTALVISHAPLCVSVSLHHSHLPSSYPSLNRRIFSIEILNRSLKQKNHPIFPTLCLFSLSSFLPMEVFEVAQVPEKGFFFFLPLCFGSVSLLHNIFPLLFCSACLLSLFSPHLSTLLQGSFFINMLISSPGILLAAHCSPGRARGESWERKGREKIRKRSESVTYNRTGQGMLAKENLALTGVMMQGRRGLCAVLDWIGLCLLFWHFQLLKLNISRKKPLES